MSRSMDSKALVKDAASRSPSRVGVLLLNSSYRPVHYNTEAVNILGYPQKAQTLPSLDAVLSPLQRASLSKRAAPTVLEITSGRRRYLCRAFQLDGNGSTESRIHPRLVLVLERRFQQPNDVARWCEQFQLTVRECETVRLLIKGLTSKQIATEMSISPNTVKAFLRLAMAKVGASNRAAMIARIFEVGSIVAVAAQLPGPIVPF